MANLFQEHEWILDTATPNTPVDVAAGVSASPGEDVYPSAIRWVGAGDGDELVIEDRRGNVVWRTVASGANYVEESMVPRLVRGFVLAQIDDGVLFVYHRLAANT